MVHAHAYTRVHSSTKPSDVNYIYVYVLQASHKHIFVVFAGDDKVEKLKSERGRQSELGRTIHRVLLNIATWRMNMKLLLA